MNKLLALFILLLCFSTSIAQESQLRAKTQKLLVQIAEYNELHYSRIGIGGSRSDQYNRYLKLRKIASIQELEQLTRHDNAVVKAYASWGLVDKSYPEIPSLFLAFLDQNDSLIRQSGCTKSNSQISRELYFHLVFRNLDPTLSRREVVFLTQQIAQLDSIILYREEIGPGFLHSALRHQTISETYYPRIRTLAIKKEDSDALIILAKYQKEEDVHAILDFGESGFEAMAEFPHPSFWPFLNSKQPNILESKFDIYGYFQAVAAYRDSDAQMLLNQAYHQLDSLSNLDTIEYSAFRSSSKIQHNFYYSEPLTPVERLIFLHKAITRHKQDQTDSLLFRLWHHHRIMDYPTAVYLAKKYPDTAAQIFQSGLLKSTNFKFQVYDYEYGDNRKILPFMMDLVQAQAPEMLPEIIYHNIQQSEFLELEVFMDMASEVRDPGFVDILLEKLAGEKNAFDMHAMTKVLLAYEDQNIDMKVVEILESNRNWDKGNWSKPFRSLLKKNRLEYDF